MKILHDLLASLDTSAAADQVAVGPFLTAVSAGRRAGLATTLIPPRHLIQEPGAGAGGTYAGQPVSVLAKLVLSERPLEAGLGLAALNAALPMETRRLREQNGFDYLKSKVPGRNLTLIGHFPFAGRLTPLARKCWILEQEPQAGDLPVEESDRIIPDSDLVVITGSAFANRSIEKILALARGKEVVVMGPSSPLSAVLFEHGVSAIAGTWVEDIDRVLRQVREGAAFRQLQGVKRVILERKP